MKASVEDQASQKQTSDRSIDKYNRFMQNNYDYDAPGAGASAQLSPTVSIRGFEGEQPWL